MSIAAVRVPHPAQPPARANAAMNPGSKNGAHTRWLLALAAQLVRDVGDLITAAARANKKLATFAMEGRIRFASAADRAAFTAELVQAVTALVAKYHDEAAQDGREHHLVIAVHPSVTGQPARAREA
jgi:type VI protein secretion system component VasF